MSNNVCNAIEKGILGIKSKKRETPVDVVGYDLAVFGPLVLATDLLLLLRGEVIGDVECLSDLLGGLALDHVRDGLAANVKEGLDIKIVGCEDDLEEHFLVDLHELLVPLLDIGGLLAAIGIIILGGGGVVLVMLAPLDDLLEDLLIDIGDRNSLTTNAIFTEILHHVLDEHGALSDDTINFDVNAIIGGKSDLLIRHLDCCMSECCIE